MAPSGTALEAAGSPAVRPFLFIHIRKTAGTSLRGLLANRFPVGRILFQAHSVSGPQQPGDARFATGHVDFDYAHRFDVWPTTFTVLREPVSRCVSACDFFQSHSETFFRTLATELGETEYQDRRRFDDRARSLGMLRFLTRGSAAGALVAGQRPGQAVGWRFLCRIGG